jgi:FSR family fosmidomycin resistance protein-like MFS transporter
MTASHIVDDFYQGAVPALLPFLVLERHYTFTEASGITLAATALSSVAQPAFGIITDKRRMGWLVAAGLTLAGIGVGLSGLANSYILTWLAIALSGLGIAAYHPEAARTARLVAAGSQARMGWFAVGGNIGFALGPVLVTPTLLLTGVSGTPLLTIPALLMGTVLLIAQPKLLSQSQAGAQQRKTQLRSLQDDWRSFFRLTGLVTCRSIMFYGFSSFLALYITKGLGLSKEIGEAGLTIFLASGAVGTLLGGWLADRLGRLQTVRLGYIGVIPALLGLVTFGQPWIFGFIALTALCVYIPFSNQVTLGQDYLPNRIGTASGVTLGLAVSVGGLCAPLLGALADATSVQLSLTLLVILPVVALALSLKLRDPQLQAKPNLSNPPVDEVLQGNPQAGV